MDTVSYWSATHAFPDFPTIDRDLEVDVVVVGAAAIDAIAAIARQTHADCDFRWTPGYLHASLRAQKATARLGDGLAPGCFAAWRGMLDLGVDLAPYQQA